MKNKLHFKYNNANFAIVCGKCSKTLKVGSDFTEDEWKACRSRTLLPNRLCEECLEKNDEYKKRNTYLKENNMNKQEIPIPEGYEFDHLASPILGNGGGVLSVILKKKQTKDFSFYVDQYLYDNGSTNDQIVNWLSDDIISIAKHRLKTSQFYLVPWEIKMGLFRFICKEKKLDWVEEMEEYEVNNIAYSIKDILPQEFIDDLFKTKN